MYAYYELGRTSTHDHPDSGGRHMSSLQDSTATGRNDTNSSRVGPKDRLRHGSKAYATAQGRTRSNPSLPRRSAGGWWPSAALEHLSWLQPATAMATAPLHAQGGRDQRLLAASQMPPPMVARM